MGVFDLSIIRDPIGVWFFLMLIIVMLLFSGAGCTTPPKAPPAYRFDMGIEGMGADAQGFAVVDDKKHVNLMTYWAYPTEAIEVVTCHRSYIIRAGSSRGLGRFKRGSKKAKIDFVRVPLEMQPECPITLQAYDTKSGLHSFGGVYFRHTDETMVARMQCNGATSMERGVSICQSRAGNLSALTLPEGTAVAYDPEKHCEGVMIGNTWEYKQTIGKCVWVFYKPGEGYHLHIAWGYNKIIVKGK